MDLEKYVCTYGLIVCIALLLAFSSPVAAEWKDTTTYVAEVVAGDEAAVTSGVHRILQPDGADPSLLLSKSTDSWLAGSDIYSADLHSSEDLAITDRSGVVHSYTTKSSQYITLPSQSASKGYDLAMSGRSFYDFSESFDTTPDLDFGLTIGDSELGDLLNLGISSDDSPADIINKFLKAFGEGGLGRNMERFLEPNNLMYGAEYERSFSDYRNGVTCSWGDAQKVSVNYGWLTGVIS